MMEYVSGGELFYHLTKTKGFGEERSRFYGAEIAVAIGFLHQHNVVYRDLKVCIRSFHLQPKICHHDRTTECVLRISSVEIFK